MKKSALLFCNQDASLYIVITGCYMVNVCIFLSLNFKIYY